MAAAAAPEPDSTVAGTRRRCAKLARTQLADPPDALSGTDTNWRDWANLTAGPAGLIGECVLADDVANYLRFRAACVSWRRSTPSPQAHDVFDSRFHPRRWIMLPEVLAAQVNRRDFLNFWTGERIQVDLPGLRDRFMLGHTSDGLILMCQKSNGDVRLLNPLTRQFGILPNARTMLSSLESQDKSWKSSTDTELRELMELRTISVGLADSSTLALHFPNHKLAVAKPSADRWSHYAPYTYYTYSTLSFANRFYCFTGKGLEVVKITDASQRPQLVTVVKVDQDFCRAHQDINLVDNDGEMILVRRNYGINNPKTYEVYLVDLDAGKIVPMVGLHGRALFVCHDNTGHGRAISVHTELSSSITADTIYKCCERNEGVHRQLRIYVYRLCQEGTIIQDLPACRGSILDYLSRYICRSEDVVVPVPAVAGPHKEKRKGKANPNVIGNEWVN